MKEIMKETETETEKETEIGIETDFREEILQEVNRTTKEKRNMTIIIKNLYKSRTKNVV